MRDASCLELEMQLACARSLVHLTHRPRAILAEPEDEQREGMAALLAAEGYELRPIRDGARLVDALVWYLHYPGELPDLLVVSDTLPTLGGREIVARLVRAGHRLPIILTTTGGAALDDTAFRDNGVVQLRKPCGSRELRAALTRLAQRSFPREPHARSSRAEEPP